MAEAAVEEDNLLIPLIDFSAFLSGSPSSKRTAAHALITGFQRAGFIYIKNHGIPPAAVARAFQHSAAFFRRPQAQKDVLSWTTPRSNRGYVAHGREKVSDLRDKADVEALRAAMPDLKESMEIGRDDEAGFPNRWPDAFDEEGKVFRDVMREFFDTCKELHVQVMRAIALGLGLEDETFFDGYCDAGDNTLRLLHYLEVEKGVLGAEGGGSIRAGAHTDYGSITLLFQDNRGGLQVLSPNGNFVDATPIADTIVVNAGDLLARWSNDSIKSTKHRVVEPPVPTESDVHPARYSIAYFCNPNFDRFIDAIPGTHGEGGKKYEGVNSGEYLVQRLTATY
ncbi:hypothetical protein BJ546DRAFT_311245 [Cryomyces antarcticus]